jgi:cytochrome b6-f complex iron-sulfur subunit
VTRRRITAFVDAVIANRRPRPFAAGAEDVEVMRAAIALRGHDPASTLPRLEFVADLQRRVAEELGGWVADNDER